MSAVLRPIDNLRIGREGAEFDRRAAQQQRHNACELALLREFTDAFAGGHGSALISTPGFGQNRKSIPAREMVYEQLASPQHGDTYGDTLVSLLGDCMRHPDPILSGKARRLVAHMALEHAMFHAGDAAAAEA